MKATDCKRKLMLGDTIRIKGEKRLAKVTGFFTNIPDPEDPECTLQLSNFTIDQYPNLLIADKTPDPKCYRSVEVVYDGGFAGFEVDNADIEEIIADNRVWTDEAQTLTKKNGSKSMIIERSHRKER